MPSANKFRMRRFTEMALLASMAMVLSYFERLIPVLHVPGVKLGLANVISLVALLLFGTREALVIALVRIVVVSSIAGSPISFIYSLLGGMVSLFGMRGALLLEPRFLSLIGVSLVGSFLHNTTQCLLLGLILGSWQVALGYYPLLVLASLLTGSVTGYIVTLFMEKIPPGWKNSERPLLP